MFSVGFLWLHFYTIYLLFLKSLVRWNQQFIHLYLNSEAENRSKNGLLLRRDTGINHVSIECKGHSAGLVTWGLCRMYFTSKQKNGTAIRLAILDHMVAIRNNRSFVDQSRSSTIWPTACENTLIHLQTSLERLKNLVLNALRPQKIRSVAFSAFGQCLRTFCCYSCVDSYLHSQLISHRNEHTEVWNG